MAIQIIPKPTIRPSPWLNILFYFSIVLLIAAVFGYLLLHYFYKKTEENFNIAQTELNREKSDQEKTLEKEVLSWQKKIEDFSLLINNHRLNSNLFNFIEGVSHPQIWFSDFSLDSIEGKVQLSGLTDSFQTLGQQLLIFKRESLIREINLSGVALGKEGRVEFTFDLLLDSKVFTK